MELWATGFNAWSQLQFDGELPAQPRDMREFSSVLKDEQIEILRTSISATLVRTSSSLHMAGFADEFIRLCSDREGGLQNITVAGNEKLTELTAGNLTQYNSPQEYLEKKGCTFKKLEDSKQIVANQTGFTALSTSGTVYTWGDGRYEACLGREVTAGRLTLNGPASKPCIVEELSDLPDKVVKISSGGYATAALTSGNDVYIWGRQGYPKLSEPLPGSPTPLDMDGMEFLDLAVGMNHLIVLTTERKVFVVGAGGNGQLGLGAAIKELEDWKEVNLSLQEGQRVVSVHAGYKNSFLIVENVT